METIRTREHLFKTFLPKTLWLTHYELNVEFPDHTPEEWRQFLRDNDKFIMKEVAAITESEARKALSKLSQGTLSSQEVAAIKQILDRSEQINKQTQDARTFVTTFMPDTTKTSNRTPHQDLDPKIVLANLYVTNKQTVQNIYYPKNAHDVDYLVQRFYTRMENGEIIQNEDGTITIPNPRTEEDRKYLATLPNDTSSESPRLSTGIRT